MLMTMMTLVPMAFGDTFKSIISACLQPFYAAISGLLALAHWLWGSLFGNESGITWVLSIITLTVIVRTLMIPLFVRQINSARNMQAVQPKMKALQQKYGNDRQKYGIEVQKLMREEGVNPAASCLPLLIQMPIFLSLYRVLDGAARNIPRGYFFRKDPSLPKSLRESHFLGAGLSDTFMPMNGFGVTQIVALLLIIGMSALLFVTQFQMMRRNMPPEALTGPMAQQQKMMIYVFPIIYVVTGLVIPIGVLIYWFTSNLWTLGQQSLLIRNNPTPNTPAYIDWEERMRARGHDPEQIQAERRAKRRRGPSTKDSGPLIDAETGKAVVNRQGSSTRSTVRQAPTQTSSNGRTVVQRQQPRKQPRSSRKK